MTALDRARRAARREAFREAAAECRREARLARTEERKSASCGYYGEAAGWRANAAMAGALAETFSEKARES